MTLASDPSIEFIRDLSTDRMPDQRRSEILVSPGFGRTFTDHMITIDWRRDRGWFDAMIRPYGPLELDPSTNVFHYGQAIFEGLKAYTQPDGGVATFRPEQNGARMQRSAARIYTPAPRVSTRSSRRSTCWSRPIEPGSLLSARRVST